MAIVKRENILSNIKSELGEISNTTVKREVLDPKTDRLNTIWGSSTYLLVLLDGEEVAEVTQKGTRSYRNILKIEINGYTKDKDNPSETMNILLASVKEKMEEDYARGGNALDTQRMGVITLRELEHPYAGFKITYQLVFME